MHINIEHDAPSALIQYKDRQNVHPYGMFRAEIKSFITSSVRICLFCSYVSTLSVQKWFLVRAENRSFSRYVNCTRTFKLCERTTTSRHIYYSIILQVVCVLFGLFLRWCIFMSILVNIHTERKYPITHRKDRCEQMQLHFVYIGCKVQINFSF